MSLFGAIEAGGTKFVCALADEAGKIHAETRFPTTTPDKTIPLAVEFFTRAEKLAAIGIASFGPVDPDPHSPTLGYITTTPKPGWANTDLAGPFRRAFNIPVTVDTDVNGAALGEHRWGAARGLDTFVYLTIGTGIGGGGMINGQLMHGLLHPEMGHMRLPHDRQKDPYAGCCPFHGDCLEGLACGPAIIGRWNKRGQELPPDHPAWELEAHYLSLAVVNITCTLSPKRVILGGGIMEQTHLFPMIRRNVQQLLNGYLKLPAILDHIEKYIVPPGLGIHAGALGAAALAHLSCSPRR